MAELTDEQTQKRIDRRRFLNMGTLTAGAVILAACGGQTSATPSGQAPATAPTTAPAGAAAAPTTAAAAAAPTTASAAAPTTAAAAAPTTAAAAAPTTAAAAKVVTGVTTNQPVEIVFNTWWIPLQDIMDSVAKDMQAANAGVTVKTNYIADGYTDKMTAALVAGNFGDAATAENSVQSKWMSSGYHVDMTSWASEDKLDLKADYGLGGLEIWCGKVLNMPMDNDDRAIYYNKTMIKAAGAKDPWDDLHGKWTWDDMIEIAQKCVKKDSSGKVTQWGLMLAYDNTQEWENMVWSLGGNYADWTAGKYNYLDPAVIKAQETMYKWATQDKFLISLADVSSMQGSSNINPFRAGLVAMYQRASYDATLNQKEIGTKFEWDAAPIPDPGSFNPGKPGVPQSTANPNFVPKGAKNAQWGYKLLAALAGDKAENGYATKKTMMVAKKSAWKTYQDTTPPTHPGSFVYYVYGRPHGFHYYSDINAEVFFNIVSPALQAAYLGKSTIQEALKGAQTKIDALGPAQSASCQAPYGSDTSPQPAIPADQLAAIGVHPYT